ncbi:oxidoreductase [Novosphingobium endophyticum]|uniref:Oxidoreductase n=1 Tax=Novosphingobium endophyticum TaxID=1955250 RepID=A0A916X4S7_9SPHN|nr:aldo/keto reductase [Novosphingobium endophyticum]GGB94722.1 oxidoreductase [Novosphingobium endophyticum]
MLKQVLVGKSGLRSSEIALGTMTFGDPRPWGCSADEARKIMARFVDGGGTTIDTAPNYADGASEEIVGDFTAGRRDQLVLSTKYTAAASAHPLAGGNSRRTMMLSADGSLRRLKTDRIDVFWLHFWDGTTPLEEILRAADDLVRAGKILYFGLSDTPAWLSSRAVTLAETLRLTPVVAIQAEYNAATRGIERDLVPMSEALDLAVFCWGPLGAGALAGGNDPRRQSADRMSPTLCEFRHAISGLAERSGQSTRRLALRWLMESGRNRIPILGARTEEQMAELLADAQEPINADLFAEVDALAKPGKLFPSPLIGSSYLRKFALGQPDLFTGSSRARS